MPKISLSRLGNGAFKAKPALMLALTEIAILEWREHRTDEDVEGAIGVVLRSPDRLIRDAIERKIAVMRGGIPLLKGLARGTPIVSVLQVGESALSYQAPIL